MIDSIQGRNRWKIYIRREDPPISPENFESFDLRGRSIYNWQHVTSLYETWLYTSPPPAPPTLTNGIRECVHCIGFKVLVNRYDYGRIACAHALLYDACRSVKVRDSFLITAPHVCIYIYGFIRLPPHDIVHIYLPDSVSITGTSK